MRSNRLRVGSELVMRVSNVASNARLFGLVSFSMLYAKLLYIVIQCLLKFRDPKSPDPKSPESRWFLRRHLQLFSKLSNRLSSDCSFMLADT